jgi:hypothetical protein
MNTASTARRRETHDPPRYGDYPELFWDLRPDEPINVEQPFVLARLLSHGTPETIWSLVPPSLIQRELPTLPLLEHTRRFWGRVLAALDNPNATTPGA